MLLESSIMLLENIYSTSVTHDARHLRLSCFYRTGPWRRKKATQLQILNAGGKLVMAGE
jgi:hypothetical protein